MIYIDSNSTDANFNFALEKYLIDELDIGEGYFLFWRTQPTLMIGKYQNPYQEINMEYAKENDINIVRRITGGGTIYTDVNGWQFSFINKSKHSYSIDFSKYTQPIIDALAELGIEAMLSGRNDLLIDGKKFSGNAQYNSKNANLHHGSILYDTDLECLVRALNVADEKIISKGIKSVKERVTNVADYMDVKVGSEAFRDIMIEHLTRDMDRYELSDADIMRINEIKAAQFDTWEWNMGKTPKFDRTIEKRYAGGKLVVCSAVQKGIIEDIQFYGDFFARRDIGELTNALIGTKYESNEILAKLQEIDAGEFIHMISLEEIFELII